MFRKIFFNLVFAVLLTSCGGDAKPTTELTLDATDFAYSPLSITVPAGEPVLLTLKNLGSLEHDFVIEKIDVKTDVIQDSGSDAHHAHGAEANYDLHFSAQVGEASVIQFTVSEPGTYQFFCSVAGHKEAGMIGELIVVTQN
jgi:uncharacterized cupredoxin-like copper-binding protein